MASPQYSILYSAPLSSTVASGAAMDVLINDAASVTGFVLANTAGRAGRRSTGLALSAYVGGGVVDIQQEGQVAAAVAGLGAGTASLVRVSTLGKLERSASPGVTDDVVGYVEADGTFHARFGQVPGGYGSGGGGGGATLPIVLTTDVSGILPAANGGTGAAALPAGGLAGLTAMAAGDALAESNAITAAAAASATAITNERTAVATLTQKTLTAPILTTPRVQTRLDIDNTGGTFQYQITPAALAANRILNLPLMTGTDTMALLAFAQTFTNKTLVAASNTITDTSAATGDLFRHNGTRFVRFARGTSLQVLRTNAGATDIEWAASASGAPSVGAAGQVNISDGAGGWSAATAVLAGASFVSIGATPATAGEIRTPTAGASWRFRDSINASDTYAIQAIADALYIGCDSTFSANQPVSTNVYALTGGSVAFGLGGTTYQYIYNGNIEAWKPCTGSSIGSSPWGAVDGMSLVTVAASNITLTAAQYCSRIIRFTGTPAATRTITFPHPASAGESYVKYIWPAQTVSGLVISTGTGTTVSLTTVNNLPIELLFTNLGVTRPTVTP